MVKDKQFYKTILMIALPAAFQGLLSLLTVIVDNIMVTSLGTTVLAGVSQSNKITQFYSALVLGLVSGSSVLISQYWGKNDVNRIKKIFSIVMSSCLFVALAFILLINLFPQNILGLLANDGNVVNAGLPYLAIVCFSYLPMALSSALIGMLRSVEVVRVTLYAAIAAVISNLSLNYVLIFGKLGFPAMGAQGAALATLLARTIELSVVWYYAFRVQKRIPLKISDFFHWDKALWHDYFRYGVPVAIGDAQWSLVGVFKAMIIGNVIASELMIAANTIAEDMMSLGMIFTSSLATGACIVIGKTVGTKDYKKTREYSNTIQIMFAVVGTFMSLLVFLLRNPYVMNLYPEASIQAKDLALQMIAIGAFTMIGTTYHASCFVGINRGAGDSKFVMLVDMICGWLIVLPLSYMAAIVWKLPMPIVFLFLRIDQCFKWIIAFFRLRGDKWIKNVTRE